MSKPLIMVGSVTYAMKGKELLRRRGFQAYVERVPRTREELGCGYGLYVPQRTDEAEHVLISSGIRVLTRMDRADLQ